MSKYICLCGMGFRKNSDAENHVEVFNNLDLSAPYDRHKIFKKNCADRFYEWPKKRFVKLFGGALLYFTLSHHFHIYWAVWESIMIGIAADCILNE